MSCQDATQRHVRVTAPSSPDPEVPAAGRSPHICSPGSACQPEGLSWLLGCFGRQQPAVRGFGSELQAGGWDGALHRPGLPREKAGFATSLNRNVGAWGSSLLVTDSPDCRALCF